MLDERKTISVGQQTIEDTKPNVGASRSATRSSTYRSRDYDVLRRRRRVPLQSAVILELPVEELGIAHEQAERRRVVDRDDVWQSPCATGR